MAPVRRYLRITKYTVLECRIYLDNPALVQSWLLNPRNPVLPRIIESIRPWVLPKLREEKDRSKKKSGKKKGIKDVVVEDDFEVSIFLTETNTRHSLLTKHKHFRDNKVPKLQSNTTKLIRETNEEPVDLDAYDFQPAIRNEEDEDDVALADIPLPPTSVRTRSKRTRSGPDNEDDDDFEQSEAEDVIDVDSDADAPPTKRRRETNKALADDGDEDDKKKMAIDVSYEGFAIYGRVLCLVVRKRDGQSRQSSGKGSAGQANMENWITSTQIPIGEEDAA